MNIKTKRELSYWVDIVLLVSFLLVAVTGVIKFLFFLNGNTLGLPVRTFNTVHDWSGIAMVVAAAVHILLHVNYLVVMTKKKIGVKKK